MRLHFLRVGSERKGDDILSMLEINDWMLTWKGLSPPKPETRKPPSITKVNFSNSLSHLLIEYKLYSLRMTGGREKKNNKNGLAFHFCVLFVLSAGKGP